MFSENGLQIDFEALESVLKGGDVITVAFALFGPRLLVDVRTNEQTGPMVAVVPPVATVQERYLWLGKHRGGFGAPQAFSFFLWPRTVRAMVAGDALRTLRSRLVDAGGDKAARQFDAGMAKLLHIERQSMIQAIRGDEPWATVWAASGSTTK